MDLVLLKPGDQDVFTDDLRGSLVDGALELDEEDDLAGSIELVSCNWGMAQQMTTDVSNSARTSGRPNLNDINVVKYVDRASPMFYRFCLSARPLDNQSSGDEPTKIFLCRNSNEDDSGNVIASIMTISLYNCMVASVQAQSHPNDMATEQLMLNFTDVSWSATHQDSAATSIGSTVAEWSITRNRSELKTDY
jgi:type VI secretion system secreted protein Hcp